MHKATIEFKGDDADQAESAFFDWWADVQINHANIQESFDDWSYYSKYDFEIKDTTIDGDKIVITT